MKASPLAVLHEFGTNFDASLFNPQVDWNSLTRTVLQRPLTNKYRKINLSKQIFARNKKARCKSVPHHLNCNPTKKQPRHYAVNDKQNAGLNTPTSSQQRSLRAFKSVSRTIMSISSIKNIMRRGCIKQTRDSPEPYDQLSLSCECLQCGLSKKQKKIGNFRIKRPKRSETIAITQQPESLEVSMVESHSGGELQECVQKSPVQVQSHKSLFKELTKTQASRKVKTINTSSLYLEQKKKEHNKFSNFLFKIKRQKSTKSFDQQQIQTARVTIHKESVTESRMKTEPSRKSYKMYMGGQKGVFPYIK